MLKDSIVRGKWGEIKEELRKSWSELTEKELERAKGDLSTIRNLLQEHYGMTKEDAKQKLSALYDQFAEVVEDVKESWKGNRSSSKSEESSDSDEENDQMGQRSMSEGKTQNQRHSKSQGSKHQKGA
jgi:hypothetical protein